MKTLTENLEEEKTSFLNLKMMVEQPAPAIDCPQPASVRPAPRSKPAPAASSLLGKLGFVILVAILSLGCYFVISRYFVQSIEVVGESMVPTLSPGSHYLLNRFAYHNASPQRGDIVVIRDPADHGFSVKRIVAVPGEAVHFVNGRVFVNTEPLDEPYLLTGTHTFTYSQAKEQLITCGEGQYFVLGDNRNVSIDSRAYGPVSTPDILGQVVLRK